MTIKGALHLPLYATSLYIYKDSATCNLTSIKRGDLLVCISETKVSHTVLLYTLYITAGDHKDHSLVDPILTANVT